MEKECSDTIFSICICSQKSFNLSINNITKIKPFNSKFNSTINLWSFRSLFRFIDNRHERSVTKTQARPVIDTNLHIPKDKCFKYQTNLIHILK